MWPILFKRKRSPGANFPSVSMHFLSVHPDTNHKDSQYEVFFTEAMSKNMWLCHHVQHVRITRECKTNMAPGPCQNVSHLACICKMSFIFFWKPASINMVNPFTTTWLVLLLHTDHQWQKIKVHPATTSRVIQFDRWVYLKWRTIEIDLQNKPRSEQARTWWRILMILQWFSVALSKSSAIFFFF